MRTPPAPLRRLGIVGLAALFAVASVTSVTAVLAFSALGAEAGVEISAASQDSGDSEGSGVAEPSPNGSALALAGFVLVGGWIVGASVMLARAARRQKRLTELQASKESE